MIMSYTVLPLSSRRQVTLCGTNVYPRPETHPDRVLQEHDLLYIFSGEQPIAQDDESFTVQAGDLLFLRAGSHHYGTGLCTVNMRNIFIHMNVLPGDQKKTTVTSEEVAASSETDMVILPTLIHCGQNNACTKLINGIVDVYWSHRPGKERRLTLLVNLLLDELADIVKMNVRTMSARFRGITGKSIHQYQLDYKLEAAYRDLRTGQHSVKDVALNYGFCDAYYFSRQFKKKFGMSPKLLKQRDPSANVNRDLVT